METLPTLLVLGLLAHQALCQMTFNPAMLAALSSSGSGGGGAGTSAGNSLGTLAGLGMAGADVGGSMTDMLLMQALSGSGSSGGTGGGLDPMTLLFLGGGGAGGTSDMMQTMLMMNAFQGGNSGGQQTSMATNIGNMLSGPGGSSSDMTPGQQNALWGVVQMSGNAQRVMDAVTTPTDRTTLERDGLPGVNPMMTIAMCPRPTNCGFAICENTEIPFTGESFYICRGCPRCRMESSQRNLMSLMSRMGGSGAGMNPAQAMLVANAVGQGGAAAPMSPEMMLALMNMQQQQQQQQNQATQGTMTIPAGAQNPSPSPGQAPATSAVAVSSTENKSTGPAQGGTPPVPRPPPAFIKAMREMSRQMRAQMNKTQNPAPSPSAPTP